MKQLIVFCLALATSSTAFADDDRDPPEIISVNEYGVRMTVADLSSDICSLMVNPGSHPNKNLTLGKMIEGEILAFINVSDTDPDYRNKIAGFWNEQHDRR